MPNAPNSFLPAHVVSASPIGGLTKARSHKQKLRKRLLKRKKKIRLNEWEWAPSDSPATALRPCAHYAATPYCAIVAGADLSQGMGCAHTATTAFEPGSDAGRTRNGT